MENSRKTASKKIDFDAINQAALNNLESLLKQWLPGGKRSGPEYLVSNPTRVDVHPSLSINVITGVWSDFGNGDKGGDPVSLFGYLFHGNDQGAAVKELSRILGVSTNSKPKADKTKKLKSEWVAIVPPLDVTEPPKAHRYRGLPESSWAYKDHDGRLLGSIFLFKTSDGKEVIPLTWCRNSQTGKQEWRWKAFEVPRPLYGLDRLTAKPDATVLIVEGEKCADAAAENLPDLACLTWPGGSKAVDKANWQPLAGRNIIVWPDCDAQKDKAGVLLPENKQPGLQAANKIAEILLFLGCKVWMMDIPAPGTKKPGYDVVDAIAEGLTGDALRDYLRSNTRHLTAQEPPKDFVKTDDEIIAPSNRHTRKTLEQLIDETEDFDYLTHEIVMQVANAGLDQPSTESLLKNIAKKANISKSSLQDYINSVNGKDSHGSNDGDGLIDELNLKHAIISIAGKVLVLNLEIDPNTNRKIFTFSARNDFELKYCNREVFYKGNLTGLGRFWLEHPRRAEYDGILFLPGQNKPGYFNLWGGWPLTPKEGCYEKFLEFVKNVICSGNQELFSYLIKWCAHLVQCPAELPETAIVLRGREGVGKNTFVDMLATIVGWQHYVMLSSLGQITGRFTGHLANILLAFCNESVWGGDKSSQGPLKSMITDKDQPVEYKGKDLFMVPNYKRIIFATNEAWAVPVGVDNRRFVIIDVSDSKQRDFEYFSEIKAEMTSGGVEAFMDYLLDVELDKWHPRDIPIALHEMGWELKIMSGGSILRWWFDVLEKGWIEKVAGYWDRDKGENNKPEYVEEKTYWLEKCPKDTLQQSYLAFCLSYKIQHPEDSSIVGKSLKEWGVKTSRPRADNPGRKGFYVLPPLAEAQRLFSERLSFPVNVFELDADIDGMASGGQG